MQVIFLRRENATADTQWSKTTTQGNLSLGSASKVHSGHYSSGGRGPDCILSWDAIAWSCEGEAPVALKTWDAEDASTVGHLPRKAQAESGACLREVTCVTDVADSWLERWGQVHWSPEDYYQKPKSLNTESRYLVFSLLCFWLCFGMIFPYQVSIPSFGNLCCLLLICNFKK